MLKNKNILITGSTKGIGRAIAELVAKEDTKNVIITGRNEIDTSHSKNIKSYALDFTDYNQIIELRKKLHSEGITIDILINNVGGSIVKEFKDFTIEEFDDLNKLNYRSTFATTQQFLEDITANKGGIINILSVAVFDEFKGNSIYSATKSAISAMMNVLREELREKGIDIVNIYAGATATEVWPKELIAKFEGRLMSPKDVAKAILPIMNTIFQEIPTIEELVIRPKMGNI